MTQVYKPGDKVRCFISYWLYDAHRWYNCTILEKDPSTDIPNSLYKVSVDRYPNEHVGYVYNQYQIGPRKGKKWNTA